MHDAKIFTAGLSESILWLSDVISKNLRLLNAYPSSADSLAQFPLSREFITVPIGIFHDIALYVSLLNVVAVFGNNVLEA